jgi:cytochrome P450
MELDNPAMLADPAGYWLDRRGAGDVQWSDAHRGWLVLGHAEASEAFRDGRRLSADRIGALARAAAAQPAAFARTVELLRGWMIFRDPPAHTRLRDPVRVAFTPRRMAQLTHFVNGVLDALLEPVVAAGHLDVRRDLAGPLPGLVIAELLGVPASQRADFTSWSDDLAQIVFSIAPRSVDPAPVTAATEHFIDFFGGLIDHYRRHPADNLLTALVEGTGEADLSEIELVGACTLLLFAGHETTTNLLTSSIGHLVEVPADQRRLRDDPTLGDTAVEELVRTMGPAAAMVRKVATDHERGGQLLRARDTVYLSIASANHDPAVFADPGYIDLGREPNPHLGFGWGLHHCLGAALARLETRLALQRLLAVSPLLGPGGTVSPLRGDVLGRARPTVEIVLQ